MRTCSECKEEKADEEFNWKSKKNNQRQSKCKGCQSAYAKAYYHSGEKVKQKARVIKRTKALYERFQEYKSTLSCTCCGEDASECLDFHHLDPNEKDHNMARICADTGSWKRVLEEIEKCIVVCANCHRKIHTGRINAPVV